MVVNTAVGSMPEHPLIPLTLLSQMLSNLKNPPEPFGEVIRTHFRLKARQISAQLDKWLGEDDHRQTTGDGGGSLQKVVGQSGQSNASGSGNSFKRDVEEMKALLAKLQSDNGASGSASGST